MIKGVSKLIGFARSIPEVQTFVEPIFQAPYDEAVMQRVRDGRVSGFVHVCLGEEFEPIASPFRVRAGSAPVVGFEMSSGRFLIGSPGPVSGTLRELVKARLAQDRDDDEYRPTLERVARFIEAQEEFATPGRNLGAVTFLATNKANQEATASGTRDPYERILLHSRSLEPMLIRRWGLGWLPKAPRPLADQWYTPPQLIMPCQHVPKLAGPGLWGPSTSITSHYSLRFGIIDHTPQRVLWISHKGIEDKFLIAAYKSDALQDTVDFVSVFDAQREVYRHSMPSRWGLVVLDWTSLGYQAKARDLTTLFYDHLRAGMHGVWGIDVPIVILRDPRATEWDSFATHKSDRLFVAPTTDAVSVLASVLRRLAR